MAGLVLLSRTPPEPPVGPRTLDLGDEPPAVVNFLIHGFRVTDDAVPATLIDLAARNVVDIEQRGPGVFYVRLRSTGETPLTAYERRVLEHLDRIAVDGVVPADALTTGPQHESVRWRRGFVSAVVSDAQSRGLSREAIGWSGLHGADGRGRDPGAPRLGRVGSRRGRGCLRRRRRAARLDSKRQLHNVRRRQASRSRRGGSAYARS